ncbi:membrane protein insertase YidC [Qipengyuania citrea]|uniref:membrane protein insertase YidC n=1 Tax=Qipengyuania citrea TaxID=225971 RepID=UPI000E90860E|nr:membrane protein insertase YidC [Qipengyuania citrea]MCZ4263661.1 membrane protein insertase YidC [Erythrobacter sp. G21629-S1]HAN90387.1 membrane protein insertase YidC [Erythrobacter sp.]MCD1590968.1 membrane protein insertase YidC [Qipengyuania citrea]HBM05636.1 membrane protein insertase YidC [Erythrobacter sp.]HBQ54642.1 membrane protein insertase YidC [Erythrobacter sp.]
MDNQRNLILAIALSFLLLLGWTSAMDYFYPQPEQALVEDRADTPTEQASQAATQHSRTGGLVDPAMRAQEAADLKTALASPDRVRIDAPRVAGSVNLRGGVVDDIVLKEYDETTQKDSEPVRIFSPSGTPAQQFAQFGWVGSNLKVPGPQTLWEADGDVLSADTPLTLTHDNGEGLTFSIRYTIDDQYMITAEQTVANTAGNDVVVQPFGLVNRTSRTASEDLWIAHSGPIGVFGDSADYDIDYDDLDEDQRVSPEGRTSWVGFTDIYWLAALVPQDDSAPETTFRAMGDETYRADMIYEATTLPAGNALTVTSRLYAGAKESAVLDSYEDAGIQKFGLAIDWGWFRWFEKPMLWLLRTIYDAVGNFGIAIIGLTFIVRGLMFPIAQRGFASMAEMKAIQPKMKALQEKYKDDKPKQQQEIMALYKSEKVNPVAGCLPMLLQIPVFFALYKVLYLAIEMRHRDFLWIGDLSAPDPANLANALAYVGIDVPQFLMIIFGLGVLAVLLGFTMWLTFRLNPSQMDPMQQKIFDIMPWILMFVMAPFAAGLLLYWVTSNVLTLAQQKYLYSKHPQLRASIEEEKARKAAEAAKAGS